jgi:hypothetical protein
MSPERKAGIVFSVAVIAILALIGVMLSTSRARGFEYTVVFKDGKGIRKGDRVRMSGVDIGLVRAVTLDRTGDAIHVQLEIDRDHREKIRTNSTAYIRDATFPNVSGQKIVEVINSTEPSPPLAARSVVQGKENVAEIKAWQFRDQVGTWTEQVRGIMENLSDSTKSGIRRGRESFSRLQEERAARELAQAPEAPDAPVAESPAEVPPDRPPPSMPDEPAAPAVPEDHDSTSPAARQGFAGARDLLKDFRESEDYQALADRTVDILRRLSEKGVPATLTRIILDWQELKKELAPAIDVLKEAGRLALANQLGAVMEAIEEMIRFRMQEFGLTPEDLPVPPESADPARTNEPIHI